MQRWVDAFLTTLATQRRLSPHSVKAYAQSLALLQKALPTSLALTDIQDRHLRTALGRYHAKGLSPRTLARHLSAWRSFFTWLVDEGQAKHNPAAHVSGPKLPEPYPRPFQKNTPYVS